MADSDKPKFSVVTGASSGIGLELARVAAQHGSDLLIVSDGPDIETAAQKIFDADLALSNHWTSTAPASRFTHTPIASIVLPNGFASLIERNYRRRSGTDTTVGEITDPRVYRIRMSLLFGIDLSVEDVAALGLF